MRKVLIVDDNNLNLKILKRILQNDYEILEAVNGKEALDILYESHESISAVLLDIVMPVMDGYQVLIAMRDNEALAQIPVIVTTGDSEISTEMKALTLGANDYIIKPYNPEVIKRRLLNTINLRETAAIVNAARVDALTGLYSRAAFFERATEMIAAHEAGYYVMACFDINGFKVINDQYGNAKGDEVLRFVARTFQESFEKIGGICCRIMADNFAVLYPKDSITQEELEMIRRTAAELDGSILPVTYSIGRYIVNDFTMTASAMYDRASMAKNSVKGRFDVHVAVYDEVMRKSILREQQIISEMKMALECKQFEVWFQPQYNHSTGALIGSEALVRWRHPHEGLIALSEFIPVFEKNGFIYELDKYVWEQVCIHLKKWIDDGRSPLPVSVNISRYDAFREDLISILTGLLKQYEIPVNLLRLEITESAFAKSADQIISVVKQLIACGFTIEIDDFGSGYSSLNTLKDVPASVLKLDMRFLENSENSPRGGNILESIVRMAKWLDMSVIAEGVETIEQADYLKSIGCSYVQGYLYARPMPAAEFERLAEITQKEKNLIVLATVDTLDNSAFWDPKSMDTLIFNTYVGGACIFEYYNGKVEMLRANDKYAEVLSGSNGKVSTEDALRLSWNELLDEENRLIMRAALKKTIETAEEATCEIVSNTINGISGVVYLRATVRMIASIGDRYLIYCTNENITEQREAERKKNETAQQLQAIMNNVSSGITAVTIKDDDVKILFANERFYEIFGYTKEQYAREVKSTFELIIPEDRPLVRAELDELYRTGKRASIEYRSRRRDGSIVWVWIVISLTKFQEIDQPVQIGVFRDITDRKKAQQMLQEADEQLKFLNDTAHELLATEDADAGIESVLAKMLEYFEGSRAYIIEMDYDKETMNNTYEICGDGVESEKKMLQNIPMSQIPYWFKAFKDNSVINIADVNALGEERAAEREILQSQRINSLIAVSMRKEDRLIGFIGIDDPRQHQSQTENIKAIGDYIVSILTRCKLDAKSKSDNKMLMSLMNDIPGGFMRMQVFKGGRIVPVYINAGYCKLVGKEHDELLEMYTKDIYTDIHPEDIGILRATVKKMLTEGASYSTKCRLRGGDGEYIYIVIFGRMTKSESDETFLNIYFTDVTEQNRLEEERKEIQTAGEKAFQATLPVAFQAMMEASTDITFVKDSELKYICCSKAFAEIAGIEKTEDIAGKTDHDLLDRHLADKYTAIDREIIANREARVNYIERLPSAEKGTARYANTSKYPLYDSAGNIIGLYGVGRDITEERAAYARLKLLTNSIQGGLATYVCTKESINVLYYNDTFCKLFGYTREEYERLTELSSISMVYKEDMPIVMEYIHAMIERREPEECIYRVKTKDNGFKWINLRADIVERSGGTVIAHAVLFDVTKQVGREERLKAEEEQLRIDKEEIRLALSQMGKMIFIYDIDSRLLNVSRAYAEKHKTKMIIENVPTALIDNNAVNEQDKTAFREFYEAILRGEPKCTAEAHIICPDGSWVLERAESVTIFDSEGKPAKAVISVEDITEQRRQAEADEVLAKLGENYYAMYLLNTEKDKMVPLKLSAEARAVAHGESICWSKEFSAIVEDRIAPEFHKDIHAILEKESVRKGYSSLDGHKELIYRQVSDTWKKVVVQPLTIINGITLRAIATITDITESKKQLEKITAEKVVEEQRAIEYESLLFDAAADRYAEIIKIDMDSGDTFKIRFEDGVMVEENMNKKWSEYYRESIAKIHDDDRNAVIEKSRSGNLEILMFDGSASFTYRRRFKDGDYRWYTTTLRVTSLDDPKYNLNNAAIKEIDVVGNLAKNRNISSHFATAFTVDINDEMIERERLKDLSEHDGLTDLFNLVRYENMLKSEYSGLDSCGILFFDVNYLKDTNDNYGHEVGNMLLCLVADSIRSITNRRIHAYRYGGDEFIVIACNAKESDLDSLINMWSIRLSTLEEDSGIRCSVAVGKAWSGAPVFVERLVGMADEDMYLNKKIMKKRDIDKEAKSIRKDESK